MTTLTSTFEGWACVELFGHRVVYAHVTEVTMFGVSFARLDIPSEPPRTEYKNPSAIYGITPITEEQVRDHHRPFTPSKLLTDASDVVADEFAREDDSWSPDDEDDLPSEVDSDSPRGAA
jgi:hypothetical protein